MTEVDEVADTIPTPPRELSHSEIANIVREHMPNESETIIEKVAWSLWWRARGQEPRQAQEAEVPTSRPEGWGEW